MDRPHSPSCERNREPILDVLREHFADRRQVLEIGSGTGQHAVHFAEALPQLSWQCSDRAENLPGIRAWLDEAALPNTPAPLELDVGGSWPIGPYDAVFSANTLHIMAWPEVRQLFARLPAITTDDALLVIYGPFNYQRRYSSDSNAAFDEWLKVRGAHMAIRDAEAVDALAGTAGFQLLADIAMPANNRSRVATYPRLSTTCTNLSNRVQRRHEVDRHPDPLPLRQSCRLRRMLRPSTRWHPRHHGRAIDALAL